MTKEFSIELHKKLEKREHDPLGLSVLKNLRERVNQSGNLFAKQEQSRLENFKNLYPEELEILENTDAYQELSDSEKQEVQKKLQDDHFRAFMKSRFGKEVA